MFPYLVSMVCLGDCIRVTQVISTTYLQLDISKYLLDIPVWYPQVVHKHIERQAHYFISLMWFSCCLKTTHLSQSKTVYVFDSFPLSCSAVITHFSSQKCFLLFLSKCSYLCLSSNSHHMRVVPASPFPHLSSCHSCIERERTIPLKHVLFYTHVPLLSLQYDSCKFIHPINIYQRCLLGTKYLNALLCYII